jgi:hypothetical protein
MKPQIKGRSLRIVQNFYPEVKTVVDANRPLIIEVSPKDVQNVNRKKHDRCVLAQACKHKTSVDGVVVALKTVYVVHGTVATRYKQGESIAREIVSFDRSGIFAPGTYRLRPPSAAERFGVQSIRRKERGAPSFKRIGFRHMTQDVRRLEA